MKETEIRRRATAYVIGFTMSLVATFCSFGIVYGAGEGGWFSISKTGVVVIVVVLALLQLLIQLLYFLHLGREPKPRLNGMAFAFMSMVVLIIGLGSLWVMYNLDYNMMPHDPEKHMEIEENINVDHSQMQH